jgi:hypothetical protein
MECLLTNWDWAPAGPGCSISRIDHHPLNFRRHHNGRLGERYEHPPSLTTNAMGLASMATQSHAVIRPEPAIPAEQCGLKRLEHVLHEVAECYNLLRRLVCAILNDTFSGDDVKLALNLANASRQLLAVGTEISSRLAISQNEHAACSKPGVTRLQTVVGSNFSDHRMIEALALAEL